MVEGYIGPEVVYQPEADKPHAFEYEKSSFQSCLKRVRY